MSTDREPGIAHRERINRAEFGRQVGLSYQSALNLLSGKTGPSLRTLHRVHDVFHIRYDDLMRAELRGPKEFAVWLEQTLTGTFRVATDVPNESGVPDIHAMRYEWCIVKGWTQAAYAEAVGVHQPDVSRSIRLHRRKMQGLDGHNVLRQKRAPEETNELAAFCWEAVKVHGMTHAETAKDAGVSVEYVYKLVRRHQHRLGRGGC